MLKVEELEALKGLSPQAKLTFYWSFSHQLTILNRSLWSEEALAQPSAWNY